MDLAQSIFPLISDEEQEKWFALLGEGPTWPARDKKERAKDGVTEEEYGRYVGIWRRNRLAALGDALPEDKRAELAELEEAYGQAEHPTFHSYTTSWTGPTSPLNEAELAEMGPEEMVEYVRTWRPNKEPMTPSPEGLGRLLTQRIAAEPQAFAEVANKFKGLDPTYVGAALRGFEDAAKSEDKPTFDWDGVVTLTELAADAPEINAEMPSDERQARDWDPDWRWSRRTAASVLEKGMSRRLIPERLADRIWQVLDVLSWDPEPTLEYEEQCLSGWIRPTPGRQPCSGTLAE